VNIVRGDNIGHCEKTKVQMNRCPVLNVYRDAVVGIYKIQKHSEK
jgi:hypothetical protein